MKPLPTAILVYQGNNPQRNALTEDNYKGLADALAGEGFAVESVLYHDSKIAQLEAELKRFSAVLVWVNPIMEDGMNRRHLDKLLTDISNKGVYVSTHPEIILKLGTKKVLYSTRSMDWGGDTEIYYSYADFTARFVDSLTETGVRVLKQFRGDGGKGVYKVCFEDYADKTIRIIPADAPDNKQVYTKEALCGYYKKYYDDGSLFVNQQWAHGIQNGMVRCYITGKKVSGFGYQESVALCPGRPVSRRFYFSEECGLFQDLRKIMDEKWIPQLQNIHSIPDKLMPLLWDIDLFINDANEKRTEDKYTLCEMNVSCVSPFPPSCISHMVRELKKILI